MSINADGRMGEELARKWLISQARVEGFFQPDWVFTVNGRRYLLEAKYQEHFTPPPFAGHGLPPKQVKARMDFQRDTDIRTVLLVFEKGGNTVYHQYLDVLEGGPRHETGGNKPRVVYPLESFNADTYKDIP